MSPTTRVGPKLSEETRRAHAAYAREHHLAAQTEAQRAMCGHRSQFIRGMVCTGLRGHALPHPMGYPDEATHAR